MTEPLPQDSCCVNGNAIIEVADNDKNIPEPNKLCMDDNIDSNNHAGYVPEILNSTLNGDVGKVSANSCEDNAETKVLLENQDNNLGESAKEYSKLDSSFTEPSPNSLLVQSDKLASAVSVQSTNVNNDCNHAETVAETRIPVSKNIDKKDDIKPYVVSTDSDDDRNIQCITMYRGDLIEGSDNSDSSDSETSSTVSDDNEDSDIISISDKSDSEDKKLKKVTRTKGELGLQDLPPIEDLKITVDENKCKPVGSVLNIVDEMVVIQSFPNTPPLDIDTVLFLDRGQRVLGKIFDVFGPVHEPFYSIRFNSRGHIQEKDVRREQVVYCAPQTEYTSYIPVAELLKEKGSDASWADNNEPPSTCVDFSDDEEEARHKRPKVNVGSKRDTSSDNDLFVKKMNQKNLELTAKRRKEDEAKQKRGPTARKVMQSPNGHSVENVMNPVHSFSPFTDAYKLKNRPFSNGNNSSSDQSSSTSYYHAASANTHSPKFESAPRTMNYLRNAAASFTPPINYTFPSQHYVCTSPRQLPTAHQPSMAAQNYLAMYQRPPVPTTVPMPPPFTNFTAASIPPMPTFVTQPSLHPSLPPTFNASVPPPPPFGNYNTLTTPPLPSSLPQPNFYPCPDAGAPVHQPTFIPLNMRPGVPPTFHPQFVLPPPPPPPPPGTLPHHTHQRDVTIGSRTPDRRAQQSTHQTTNSFYPKSPSNS